MNIFEDHGLDLLFHKMDEQVLSIESTLQLIVSERVSVSRFGDGEINYVLNSKDISCQFQEPSTNLTKDLCSVLLGSNERHLVCLPGAMTGSPYFQSFWQRKFERFSNYIDFNQVNRFGNSFISRSAALKSDRNVSLWKSIWDGRDLVFVYGAGSRFNCRHDLFDNIRSYKEVLSTPTNAYSDRENA